MDFLVQLDPLFNGENIGELHITSLSFKPSDYHRDKNSLNSVNSNEPMAQNYFP
jgi:hypothetical protein